MTQDRFPAAGGTPATPGESPASWERGVLERVALAAVTEQRRARRWSIFFRLAGLLLVATLIALATGRLGGTIEPRGRHTAVVALEGTIEAGGRADAESVTAALRAAFEDSGTAGVVLRINSPGGSPVQAALIYDEIGRLRAKHPGKPIHAVVEETCASGGYYVAAAAERIFVNPASIVGSIGVRLDSFGLIGLTDKLGVERRLFTAGSNKAFLDPFLPVSEAQRQHVQAMLAEVHAQFIDAVRKGRGERLKEAPELFSGLFWTGARSVELGLADAVGSVDSVARDVIKADRVVDFSRQDNLAERVAKRIGAEAGRVLAAQLASGQPAPAPLLR